MESIAILPSNLKKILKTSMHLSIKLYQSKNAANKPNLYFETKKIYEL